VDPLHHARIGVTHRDADKVRREAVQAQLRAERAPQVVRAHLRSRARSHA
jgi:hypothetical protein